MRRVELALRLLLPMLFTALVVAVLPPLDPNPMRAEQAPPRAASLRVATFNALGNSHTKPGGDRPGRLDGVTRTRILVKIIDYRRLDVVALQEFQPRQQAEFKRVAGRRWGLYCPGPKSGRDNCLAWRRATVRMIHQGRFFVPYFNGYLRTMPWAYLMQRSSKIMFLMTSVHNPTPFLDQHAGSYQRQGWRTEQRLVRDETRPVLLAGDRNAKARTYLPRIPSSHHAAGRRGIDFIVGNPLIRFSGYQSVLTRRIRAATDHPLVYVTVTFTAEEIR